MKIGIGSEATQLHMAEHDLPTEKNNPTIRLIHTNGPYLMTDLNWAYNSISYFIEALLLSRDIIIKQSGLRAKRKHIMILVKQVLYLRNTKADFKKHIEKKEYLLHLQCCHV